MRFPLETATKAQPSFFVPCPPAFVESNLGPSSTFIRAGLQQSALGPLLWLPFPCLGLALAEGCLFPTSLNQPCILPGTRL